MDAVKKQPPTSFLATFTRWLSDFERAMDMRPVDYLELRVAELERRLSVFASDDSDSGTSNKLQIVRKG